MFRVVLARFLALIPLLLGVSFVSFLLIHLAPGSFVDRLRLDPGIPPSTVEALVNRLEVETETEVREEIQEALEVSN